MRRCQLHGGKSFTGARGALQKGDAGVVARIPSDQLDELEHNCTPMMIAAGMGHVDVLAALLKYGAHLEGANDDGETAVLTAVHHGQFAALRFLLEKGANWRYQTASGVSPLWNAVARADMAASRFLLDKGGNPDETGDSGVSLLAQTMSQGNKQLARLLLDRGARPDGGAGDVRWDPLSVALSLGNLDGVRMLIDAGAEKSRSSHGAPAWFFALQSSGSKSLEKILARGVDVNARASRNDETPLIAAANFGHAEAVKMLIEAGAKPDAQDAGGNTALIYAARGTHRGIIEDLLRTGAQIDCKRAALPRLKAG